MVRCVANLTDNDISYATRFIPAAWDACAWVRCNLDNCPCPYPGGYWKALKRDQISNLTQAKYGRYWIVIEDADDAFYQLLTDDESKYNETWEYITTIPDLKTQDFVDLGFTF